VRSRPAITAAVLAAALACWLSARQLQAAALEARADQPSIARFVPPAGMAPVFAAGYRELAATLLWCRTLVYYGSARAETADYRYLNSYIDNIITLNPGFERAYTWASYAVTFKADRATQEEYRDSVHYLELGMKAFPADYELFWLAGLRYYLDLWDEDEAVRRGYRERGVELIELAMHKPNAPDDLGNLAAALRSRLGQRDRAIANLRQMILTTDNKQAQERMLRQLHALSSADVADDVRRAADEFAAARRAHNPLAPAGFHVILGPRPPAVIDLAELATPPGLFGLDLDLDLDGDDEPLFDLDDDIDLGQDRPVDPHDAHHPGSAAH
jgi:hypothetical protein